MRALVIAIGNPLRADDGIAHRVADLLRGATLLRVHQLAPEIAAELNTADTVVFLDADPTAESPSIERVQAPRANNAALSHSMTPETLLAIAQRLYGFRGEAWLCRLHARDFSVSTDLSPEAVAQIEKAAQIVQQFLEERCTSLH